MLIFVPKSPVPHSKKIVLSGHGVFSLKRPDPWTRWPFNAAMHCFSDHGKTLDDRLGQILDVGDTLTVGQVPHHLQGQYGAAPGNKAQLAWHAQQTQVKMPGARTYLGGHAVPNYRLTSPRKYKTEEAMIAACGQYKASANNEITVHHNPRLFRHVEYLGKKTPPLVDIFPELGLQITVGWNDKGFWIGASLSHIITWLTPVIRRYAKVDVIWSACSSIPLLKRASARKLASAPTVPSSRERIAEAHARVLGKLPHHVSRAERFADLDALGHPALFQRLDAARTDEEAMEWLGRITELVAG